VDHIHCELFHSSHFFCCFLRPHVGVNERAVRLPRKIVVERPDDLSVAGLCEEAFAEVSGEEVFTLNELHPVFPEALRC
jgi:hypothetical protein